jgi:multidrug efflux system outer membrane protein
LRRRPDIRETEALLHSANAQVGVAVADFFPRLSLTGLFGQVSPELSALTSGGANAWSLGSTLAGPLFHGGQLVGRYRQQIALREEAELRYRLAVLVALQDVSNALISREKYAQERVEQARAVVANQTAVQVATERYVAGRAGYYELLLQQQQLFPAENSLVQTELNQWLSLIQLYRALGGGW